MWGNGVWLGSFVSMVITFSMSAWIGLNFKKFWVRLVFLLIFSFLGITSFAIFGGLWAGQHLAEDADGSIGVAFRNSWPGQTVFISAMACFALWGLPSIINARVRAPSESEDVLKIYSPNQVLCGSLLGGPAASILMLQRNFIALGENNAAKMTVIWGVILSIALLGLVFVLPKSFPNTVLPAIYSVIATRISSQYQMSKEAIAGSDRYSFRSNWHVAGLGVVSLVATGLVIFLGAFILVLTGTVHFQR